jgi:hypothetical protein
MAGSRPCAGRFEFGSNDTGILIFIGRLRIGSTGQSDEDENLSVTANLRRPHGAPVSFSSAFPALKRWANIRCAYGAKRSELLKSTTTFQAIALAGSTLQTTIN